MPDFVEYIGPLIYGAVTLTGIRHFDSWSGQIKQEDLLPGMELVTTHNYGKKDRCHRIDIIQVCPNGDIRLCGCRFLNNENDELLIGNINNIGLIEAFNSSRAKTIRSAFEDQRWLDVCSTCSWYEA